MLELNSGILDLQNNTPTAFAHNVLLTGSTTLCSDVASSGNGVTHSLGTLTTDGGILTVAPGPNVTGGTAGITFAATIVGPATAGIQATNGTLVNLGAITRAAGSGTLNLDNSGGGFFITGTPGTSLGPWATANGMAFAVLNSTNAITNYSPVLQDNPSLWGTGQDISENAGFTANPVAPASIHSLRFVSSTANTVNIGSAASLTIASGGILVASAGAKTISGGILAGPAGGELIFNLNNPNTNLMTVTSKLNTGGGWLVKAGAGTLILSPSALYSNNVAVNGGTLVVNAALGGGAVTLNSGVLYGSGSLGGAVTVAGGTLGTVSSIDGPVAVTGGSLIPGFSGISELLISNSLTLGNGGSVVMQLDQDAGTNDSVRGVTTLTYGGTLMVTNLGSTGVVSGDRFKLFNAANYQGAFTAITPAIPRPGMAWDLLRLTVDGTLGVAPGAAYLWMPGIFASGMVLQRNQSVPIWGVANVGQTIMVTFGSQVKTTTAGMDGSWMVYLDPMPANLTPQTLVVSGASTLIFSDVLVGDVWLCSGQSNMWFGLSGVTNGTAEVAAENYPNIRNTRVSLAASQTTVTDAAYDWSWVPCLPSVATNDGYYSASANISAVAYFFARAVYLATNVPIGLIISAYPGTGIEAWTSLAGLTNSTAELSGIAAQELSQYPVSRNLQHTPGTLFNAMIAPLIPYGLKGMLWYQGEDNGGNQLQYRVLLPALVADWRARWGLGNFPVYIAQLPNYSVDWTYLREAQSMALDDIPNPGLAVTIDVGSTNTIHPTDKQDVGLRLAQWALAGDGFNVTPSGPIYSGYEVAGGAISLSFQYAGAGLIVGQIGQISQSTTINPATDFSPVTPVANGTLAAFEIAGADGNFYPANAVISGGTVVVSSPSVPAPVMANYGQGANPPCNLYNRAGLPASPFRTTTNVFYTASLATTKGQDRLTLSFPTNATFWVGSKDQLTDRDWTPVAVPQTSTALAQTVTNATSTTGLRFYRYGQMPP